MPDKTEKEKEYQAGYYQNNRERLLEYRRAKYAEDAEYRQRAKARDARNYWYRTRSEPTETMPDIAFEDIKPRGQVEIVVDNPGHPEHGKVLAVNVYGTTQLSQILNRDGQTIRGWLKSGVIPGPAIRGMDLPEGHELRRGRSPYLFTEDEARALYSARHLLALPYGKIETSLFANKVRQEFERLPQGLNPYTGSQKLKGVCEACGAEFSEHGDPKQEHYCRSCGFDVKILSR